MNVLISIKPKYAYAIISGVKKYEFRRTIFKRIDIDRVYLYCNSNIKKIIGSFKIDKVLEGNPYTIWNKCGNHGGISRMEFFKYYKGTKKAYAIKIKNLRVFNKKINPYTRIRNFVPPQSFYYIDSNIS